MRVLISGLASIVLLAPVIRADAPEGFQSLFDGKSLDGWKLVNTKDNFVVRDGRLVMDKGKGWLASEKTYTDFELRVRYRFVTPGADSGIFIRAGLDGPNWTNHGYQVQNMDNQTLGMVVGMGVKRPPGQHDVEATRRAKKPSGEFNDLVIVVKGKTARVTLNGTEVASTDALEIPEGHIGLQAEGGILEFERIDLKPL